MTLGSLIRETSDRDGPIDVEKVLSREGRRSILTIEGHCCNHQKKKKMEENAQLSVFIVISVYVL